MNIYLLSIIKSIVVLVAINETYFNQNPTQSFHDYDLLFNTSINLTTYLFLNLIFLKTNKNTG